MNVDGTKTRQSQGNTDVIICEGGGVREREREREVERELLQTKKRNIFVHSAQCTLIKW